MAEKRVLETPALSMPQLFVNGHPALTLFLYHVRKRMNRAQIHAWLESAGLSRFSVGRVGFRDGCTHAVINVDDIGVSAHLQVLALMNELSVSWWGEGAQGQAQRLAYARVKPDRTLFAPPKPHPLCGRRLPCQLRAPLSHVFNDIYMVEILAAYMDASSFFSLYAALDQPASLQSVRRWWPFDAALARYSGEGALAAMEADAATFRFSSFSFRLAGDGQLEPSIVLAVLEAQKAMLARTEGVRAVALALVDLTSINVSPALLAYLKANFEARRLVLARTRTHIGVELAVTGLESLELSGSKLCCKSGIMADQFPWLHTLTLARCSRISAVIIRNFIAQNQILRCLDLNDCTFREEALIVFDIIHGIYSGHNKLESVTFAYTRMSHNFISRHWVELTPHETLRSLNIVGNQLFGDMINGIALNSPSLTHFYIQNLESRSAFALTGLSALQRLDVSYDHTLDHSLDTLAALEGLREVNINNNFGRKSTKALQLSFLRTLLPLLRSFKLNCTKCKIAISRADREFLQALGAVIQHKGDSFSLQLSR